MNFGPYQYVVTIHSSKLDSLTRVVLTNKQTAALHLSCLVGSSRMISWAGMQEVTDLRTRYYFGSIEAATNNFQSYYLLVDNCLSRDASGYCGSCPPGTAKSSLAPANQCLHPSEYPAASGLDPATESVRPCVPSNCLDCTNNYQICTECDTSRGYILQDGSCDLKPVILHFTPTLVSTHKRLANLTYQLVASAAIEESLLQAIKLVSQDLLFGLEMVPKDKLHPEFVQLKQNVYWMQQAMQVALQLGTLGSARYSATFHLQQRSRWRYAGVLHELVVSNHSHDFFNEFHVERLSDAAQVASNIMPVVDQSYEDPPNSKQTLLHKYQLW